jgi:hypothetical protein
MAKVDLALLLKHLPRIRILQKHVSIKCVKANHALQPKLYFMPGMALKPINLSTDHLKNHQGTSTNLAK